PAAQAERPVSVQLKDLRGDSGQRARRVESGSPKNLDIQPAGLHRSAVRMPSGPPLTLSSQMTLRLWPSKLTTDSNCSPMLWTSKVLPSRLQATPWSHFATLTSATLVIVVPSTLNTTKSPFEL